MDQIIYSQTVEQALAKAWVFQVLALTVLWFMYAYLYRPYRIDLMRHRLFTIRRKLFHDAVDSDDLSHNDKPYVELRSIINGMIRFAHELTFFEFISLTLLHKNKANKVAMRYRVEVEKSFDELPDDLRDRLHEYRGHIAWIVLDHIMHVSLPAFLILVPFGYLMEFTVRTRLWFDAKLKKIMRRPVFAILEQQARESGRDECAV